jgi:hypothetical protein
MRQRLPEHLNGRPFTIHDAALLGVGRGRLAGRDLTRPSGVRSVAEVLTVPQRAWAFALVLPDDVVFSHVTAARIWDLPLPATVELEPEPLHVMRESSRTRIRRHGCRGHLGLEHLRVDTARRMRVTALPDTWVDLGRPLPDASDQPLTTDDLIVAGDQVARRLASVEPLRRAMDRRPRVFGRPRLEEALRLVRPGSSSPMETRARVMFVRAGLPEPELNVDLSDELGEWLETSDFVWRKQRVIGEYQGEHHATLRRRDLDNRRRLQAEGRGWTVIEVFASDIFHGTRRVACLQRFAEALGCDTRQLDLS